MMFALYTLWVLVVGVPLLASSPLDGALRRLYRLYLVPATWTLSLVSLRRSLARYYPQVGETLTLLRSGKARQ